MSAGLENKAGRDQVAEALSVALGPVLGGPDQRRIDVTTDGLISVRHGRNVAILAEWVFRPSAVSISEAWHRLRPHAEAQDAVAVLLVPRATASLRKQASEEGINWVDLAGNATIDAPRLRVHIDGKKRVIPPRVAPSVDPFARRSANLVRLLLVEPDRPWRQNQLVQRSRLSQPRASKVLSALQEMSLLRRQDDGSVRVTDPAALLDAWADVYSYRRLEIVPAHMTGEGPELARSLQDKLQNADISHWFTGLPAAWAYEQFAAFRLVSVFVDGDPDLVARVLRLRTSTRGANKQINASGDQRLETGQADASGLRCAHATQVYLDLLGLPERAREAAEHLRPLAVGHRRG